MLKLSPTPLACDGASTDQQPRAEKHSARSAQSANSTQSRAASVVASSLTALTSAVQAFRDAGVDVREQTTLKTDSRLPVQQLPIQQCLTDSGIAFEIKLAEHLVEKKFLQHPSELSRIAALKDFSGDTKNAKLSCVSSFSAFIQEINYAINPPESRAHSRAFQPRAYKTEMLLPRESKGLAGAARRFFGVKPVESKAEQLAHGIGLSDLSTYAKDLELVTECAKAETALRQSVAGAVAESLENTLSLSKDTLGLHIVRVPELVTLVSSAAPIVATLAATPAADRRFMGLPGAAIGIQDKIEIQFQLAAEVDQAIPHKNEILLAAKRFVEAANLLAKESPRVSVHLVGESGQSSSWSHDPKKGQEIEWRRARARLVMPTDALPTLLPKLIDYINGPAANKSASSEPAIGTLAGASGKTDLFATAADFGRELRHLAFKA